MMKVKIYQTHWVYTQRTLLKTLMALLNFKELSPPR